MKASKMLIATLKETPNEAVISSHILLLRAGMIRKLVAGVYNYLPLGLRTLRKIEDIVRDEMDKSGANEILSSAMQPKELWEESGRWYKYGPELIRFKDRHDREFCLGPTHEEIFTDLVRNEIKSKKNLPINIYQIQTKYRDEFRPRFGLMRGREFIMKDAYSFDTSYEGLDASYQNMYDTYCKIFTRLGLNYQIVLADTGAIGGSGSHQFMALSDVGESDICYCECGYAADQEKAESKPSVINQEEEEKEIEEVETVNKKTIEEVSSFLNVDSNRIVKSLVYKNLSDNSLVLVLVRGDKEVNEIKVVNALNIAEHELVLASYDDIVSINSIEGFVGPVGIKDVKILVDEEVTLLKNFIVGANKKNYHLKNVNYARDFVGKVGQFRKSVEGDICPVCGKPLKLERGIEVGQIFKLGTKYSKPLNCSFQDDDGQVKPMIMGCYGIGITRTMSAIVEQNHDDFGIIWPINVAPYHVVVIPISYQDETMKELADKIHEELQKQKVEVVLDDRNAKPGFKFKDWELIGLPYQIIVGKRASEGIVELKDRRTLEKKEVNYLEAISFIVEKVRNI
ncbi:MAG: proline--tRNA ligase [Bacillales bacterium]|nr:proline--tRNA ligase [Bacillales bacterium]